MRSSIIDTIMLSEKRRDLMLYLSKGSKTREEIVEALEANWNLLKQPVKELKDAGLIFQKDNDYRLSNNGQLMITSLMPLLKMVNTFSSESDYWVTRNLQAVPHHLAKRMGELENSSVLTLSLDSMFEPLKHFLENTAVKRRLKIVISLFDPEAPRILKDFAEKNIEILLIFEKHTYEKMNESFGDELKSLNDYENVNFFMIEEEINPPEIVLGDEEMTIIFFNLNGKYDYRELLSSDNASLDWGNELFDYYKGISKPLVEK
ncbi:Predicted transcriptional regulator, contains HTH domain [Methanolobus vulcani]|jgi:Predicted transcriptional regulator|uniref:Predicted transcriptional regulator, contains HTH domain n=2 Tax=Methanolobus vulcani TaxID=38026 RepID=A0A7Z7AZ94_9EURY|nr:hypothetical protein [Methanolobus sp.]MDK2948157.1 hypothetical protein [Methanolobus sp.]SDG36816.1 Predicted transcriptional regulator, contains HTH domain [Methanolobus vulcani]